MSTVVGKKAGGHRSLYLSFALLVFFTIASSFGITILLETLIKTHSPLPFVSPSVYPLQEIGVVEPEGKGNDGGVSFYRTIIDNNLFRPLGWRPPRPVEPYRLLGTILPRRANTPPKAIIQTTAGNKTYIVSIGETLDASTEVVSIESKSVVLQTNGQKRTLRLNTAVYLNPSPARRPPIRTTDTPTPTPIRTPTPMRRPPAVSAPLSDWETREGDRIGLGDARLKNPQKWGLRRR